MLVEEAFAPLVAVQPYHDFAEAVREVNASRYGLQAGVFTSNLQRALAAWESLEVGAVVIGDIPGFRVDHMPYGGVKDSGLGREGVRSAMEEMTEERLLIVGRSGLVAGRGEPLLIARSERSERRGNPGAKSGVLSTVERTPLLHRDCRGRCAASQ